MAIHIGVSLARAAIVLVLVLAMSGPGRSADLTVREITELLFKSSQASSVNLEGLDLNRTVYLYGVAGRQRSNAATGLIKLLRASDWSVYSA